jgi:hypothetical protein
MSAKTRAEVFVQPKNRRPLKKTAIVLYANRAELKKQIQAYAATVWINARRIDVDDNSLEILVDGAAVANYRLHIAGGPPAAGPAHAAPVQVVTKRRGAPARHLLAQIAVIAAGLILTLAAGPHINGAYIAGAALAVFGIYRLGLGVQRREAQA